jgi:hypothetical protein
VPGQPAWANYGGVAVNDPPAPAEADEDIFVSANTYLPALDDDGVSGFTFDEAPVNEVEMQDM